MTGLYIFLGILGGYVGSSAVLFFFPTLLHKKKKPPFHAMHISHRGGAGERLENTMEAFRNAAQHHTDMFEIDVQLTKDGRVVISHDDDLSRVTGTDVLISDCNYQDLPRLLSTLEVTFGGEGTFISRPDDEGKITLLRSVLEEFPNIALNIDTKLNDEVIDKTLELIREFKREHNVVMANFRNEAIVKIHKRAPELMLGLSLKRTVLVVLSFYFGLLPFLPLKEDYFELFLPKSLKQLGRFKNWHIQALETLLIRRALFRHLQRRGIQVYLFIINEEEDYDYCFNQLGVDGVMTDYPTKLETYLKMKNARTENRPSTPLLGGSS